MSCIRLLAEFIGWFFIGVAILGVFVRYVLDKDLD